MILKYTEQVVVAAQKGANSNEFTCFFFSSLVTVNPTKFALTPLSYIKFCSKDLDVFF